MVRMKLVMMKERTIFDHDTQLIIIVKIVQGCQQSGFDDCHDDDDDDDDDYHDEDEVSWQMGDQAG